jgi:hypothetical protein
LFIFITFKLITGKGLQLRFISYRCCVTLFVMERETIIKRGYKLFCVMKFRRNVYISLCFETSTELDYQITYWHKTVLSNYLLTQNWIIKLLIDTKLDYQITYWHKTGLSNYLLPHNKVYTLFLLESPPYWLLNTDYSIQLCLFFTPPYHNILICENTILGFLHICLVYCRLLISFTYHKG